MAKNNPTKRWQLSLSRTNFVAVMGLLICMLGLCMLPNFSKFTDTEILAWFKNSHFDVTKTSANSPLMKAGFYFC